MSMNAHDTDFWNIDILGLVFDGFTMYLNDIIPQNFYATSMGKINMGRAKSSFINKKYFKNH